MRLVGRANGKGFCDKIKISYHYCKKNYVKEIKMLDIDSDLVSHTR